MEKLLGALIDGVAFGCVYALLAVGLTLAYKTSGVFNIAFGVQAFVSGAIYYQLHVNESWGIIPAFVIAVIIVAPLIGVILDRFTVPTSPQRRTDGAAHHRARAARRDTCRSCCSGSTRPTRSTRPESCPTAMSCTTSSAPHSTATSSSIMVSAAIGRRSDSHSCSATPRSVSACGPSSRARAWPSSREPTPTASARRRGSCRASLPVSPGVLLPTVIGQVGDIYYTTLLTAAIAAVVLGSLTSIPLAFVGAIGLGVVQEILNRYLPTNSLLASNLRPSLPVRRLVPGADPLAAPAQPQGDQRPALRSSIHHHPHPSSEKRSRELTIAHARAGRAVLPGRRVLRVLPRQRERRGSGDPDRRSTRSSSVRSS